MKKTLYLILIVASIMGSCAKNNQSNRPAIEGTWKTIYGSIIDKDTSIIYPASIKDHYIKMIGEKYFTTIWQDTSLDKDNYWYTGFNGGTYTFENGVYTETELYFNDVTSIGQQVSFKTEFMGDTLILNYIDPSNSVKYTEKMVRMK